MINMMITVSLLVSADSNIIGCFQGFQYQQILAYIFKTTRHSKYLVLTQSSCTLLV